MSFPVAANLDWEEMTTQRSTQKFPLGTVGRMLDGRAFRYTKNGATALPVGSVVQGVAAQAWNVGGTSGPFALENGTTQTSTWKTLQLETTFTTLVAKDYFKDGWLIISDTGRLAFTNRQLQIKSSKAHTASSTLLEITLMDGQHLLQTQNTSNSGFSIMRSPYDSVIEVPQAASNTAAILGVPPIAVTASYYFWLQTWGLAAMEASAAISKMGAAAAWTTDAASTGVEVGATGLISYAYSTFGDIMAGALAAAYCVVDLKINP